MIYHFRWILVARPEKFFEITRCVKMKFKVCSVYCVVVASTAKTPYQVPAMVRRDVRRGELALDGFSMDAAYQLLIKPRGSVVALEQEDHATGFDVITFHINVEPRGKHSSGLMLLDVGRRLKSFLCLMDFMVMG